MSNNVLQDNIDKAQAHIDSKKEQAKQGKMRQRYHFMAETGWINDPNGLIDFNGKYHFFYQHNPYDSYWGAMHWGHAVSDDMLHWEYLPLALAPSEPYDNHKEGGCFSGSSIVHDGKLFLIYTGTTNYGEGFIQTQNIAYSEDGIHFTKYENNPVIQAPEGVPADLFRDPKVWKHGDMFYMVCGASRNKRSQALLYRSADLYHWEFFNVLAESRGEWGYMWECPDFYPIGDKFVLMFSPMGGGERSSVYLVGDLNYETGKFTYSVSGEIDWGFDFYAPQSFLDRHGRRIIVGWANAWDWMPWWKDWGPSFTEGWCGAFNTPREVMLCEDNTLRFVPIKELEQLHCDEVLRKDMVVEDTPMPFAAGDGVAFDLELEVDLAGTRADEFSLLLRSDGQKQAVITFDLKRQMMYFDRENSDGWSKGCTKSPLLLADKRVMKIRVLSDQSSIEVFTDDYKTNHSCNVFAGNGQNQNAIVAKNGELKVISLKTWGMIKVMDEK
ncbi:MAG TPA: glycoside hydrolase family 32 protein [Clostridiales bacterium]|nr:glycoside hydrolase family 32 protein [Clostridiales bacterium]